MVQIDNYARVEELLTNYKMIELSIKNLEQEIEYIKEDTEIKGISYDRISTSPTNEIKSIVESTVLGNIEKTDYLEHIIKRNKIDLEKIDKALEVLEDVERIILIEKYINAKRWWQVGGIVKYGERHCKRIRTDAINKMITGIYG